MQFIKRYTAAQYVSRLLAAFTFVLLLTLANSKDPFFEKIFYESVNFPVFLVATLTLFATLCFMPHDRLINWFTVINLTLYFTLAADRIYDVWFFFGMCLVLGVTIYFLDFGKIRIKPPKWSLWVTVGAMAAIYAAVVGIASCWYYWDHWTATYDFGIFAQMFHHMKQSGQMLTTCERDGLLSHFAVHFSPIYYVLLPFYCLFPTPETLLIGCAAVVATGIIPLVLLCRKYKLSAICCVAFSVIYMLYPGFLGGLFYPIHENCFLVTLLLWFFYFVEKDLSFPASIFAFLTMTVKEDAPVYIAIAAIYFIVANKSRVLNLFILAFSILYFLIVTEYMRLFGEGIMDDMRYGDYIYDDGGLLTVVKSLIQNPAFAIKQIFKVEKIIFILQMMAPLCFLPLFIRKPGKLVLLIPLILINLLSNYPYQADIGFQYNFGSGAFLIYLAITNYAELGKNRSKILLCALLSSLILFTGNSHGKFKYYETYKDYAQTRKIISEALTLVPEDATVAASTFYVPVLSQRDEIYDLGYTNKQAEYIVVDLRVAGPEDVNNYMNDSYEVLCYKETVIAVFRNLNYKPAK